MLVRNLTKVALPLRRHGQKVVLQPGKVTEVPETMFTKEQIKNIYGSFVQILNDKLVPVDATEKATKEVKVVKEQPKVEVVVKEQPKVEVVVKEQPKTEEVIEEKVENPTVEPFEDILSETEIDEDVILDDVEEIAAAGVAELAEEVIEEVKEAEEKPVKKVSKKSSKKATKKK